MLSYPNSNDSHVGHNFCMHVNQSLWINPKKEAAIWNVHIPFFKSAIPRSSTRSTWFLNFFSTRFSPHARITALKSYTTHISNQSFHHSKKNTEQQQHAHLVIVNRDWVVHKITNSWQSWIQCIFSLLYLLFLICYQLFRLFSLSNRFRCILFRLFLYKIS